MRLAESLGVCSSTRLEAEPFEEGTGEAVSVDGEREARGEQPSIERRHVPCGAVWVGVCRIQTDA